MAKLVTVRVLITIATARQWPIHHIDINHAFLHGHLDEKAYMAPPQGYTKAKIGQIYKLLRSLYGLKQAGRQWNVEFYNKLHEYSFSQSYVDHILFLKHADNYFTALLVYVGDVLITATSKTVITNVKAYLHKVFTIKVLGYVHYFLGLEIAHSALGTYINQRKYILYILYDVGLTGSKPIHTPLPKGLKLVADQGAPFSNLEQYRRLIGRLLYLNFTRTYITFAVQQLSQFVGSPCLQHVALHVLRYLKGCPSKGLYFPINNSL